MSGDNGGMKLSGAEKPMQNTGGNGELKTAKEKAEEIESQAQSPDLGKAQSPDLGQATSLPTKEIPVQNLPPKGETPIPEKPPTDFKVAEIWIRSNQVRLEASEEFWQDRCRALGLLELCKDIVKTAQAPKKPNIIVPGSMRNFARNLFKRRR